MRQWNRPRLRVAVLLLALAGLLLVVLSGCDPQADATAIQQASSAPTSSVGGGGTARGGSCKGHMSLDQIAQLASSAGFSGRDLVIAVAITQPESGGCPGIVQQGEPWAHTGWGLWQITPGDSSLLDPQANATAAYAKYRGAGGFSPWTTYTDGAYRTYMAAAAQAVAGLNG